MTLKDGSLIDANGKKVETALKVYYVSDENYSVPKQVGEYEDLSFLSNMTILVYNMKIIYIPDLHIKILAYFFIVFIG